MVAIAAFAVLTGLIAGINPALALVVALAAALMMLALLDLTTGLVGLVLIAFVERVPLAGSALSFAKIAGLIVFLSWLAHVTTGDRNRKDLLPNVHPLMSYVLVLLVSWAAISMVWADGDGAGRDLSRYLLDVALLMIVFTGVQSRRQAAWLFGAFIAGATIASAYGVIVRPDPTDPTEALRLTSTIADPNVLAAALAAGLILSLGAIMALRKSSGLRLLAIPAAGVMLLAFLFTGSRGGLAGLAVGIVVAIAVGGRWRAQVALACSLLAIFATTYFAIYAPEEIRDRITATTSGETRAVEARSTIWQVAWRAVEDRPVVGLGIASFDDQAVRYALEPGSAARTDKVIDSPSVVHNTYLQLWAELGLVGLGLFLLIVAFCLSRAGEAARNFRDRDDRAMEIMARALIVALAAVLVADFFISEQFSKQLWLLMGLGPALAAISRSEESSPAGERLMR